jgi:transcriptional regulator with XRE-family HTH domain
MNLLPKHERQFIQLGENIKLARLRRKLSAAQVAERAGISRTTLWSIESGSPTVAMGAYFMTLFALGLEDSFLNVANDDTLGRKLQDLNLLPKKRAPKKS